MNAREILSNVRNLEDWPTLAHDLETALEYAQEHLPELEDKQYLDAPNGIVVNLEPYDDLMTAVFYLGTVFSLTPSGKYYTFWANSNVHNCPRCHGSGHTRKLYDCEYCNGTGKRFILDMLNGETPEVVIARIRKNGHEIHLDTETGNFYVPCWACDGSGKRHHSCVLCGGLGSREAYEDQIWNEELDRIADKYGFYVQGGEGDPCDLFAQMSVDYYPESED